MQRGAISFEANLIAKRARMRAEKRVTYKEEPVASTSDAKIDNLVRVMERMMDKISLNERASLRENQENPQNINRNQNFRRDPPQNRQRDNDQQIRPPFQENYVDEEETKTKESEENHVNLIDSNNEVDVFLIEEETIKMRIFSQSLGGEAKKWFKNFTPNNIHDLLSLYQKFINK